MLLFEFSLYGLQNHSKLLNNRVSRASPVDRAHAEARGWMDDRVRHGYETLTRIGR